MRLSEGEVSGVIKGITALLPSVIVFPIELRLYGSRVDDTRKGGDIDLLLVISDKKIKNELIENKHILLSQIKKYIGEQKIDILIKDPNEVQSDPFIETIYPNSILLYKWK
ncbi:MAG: nucleotidyltransferase domain-containing protein [Candidatus Berkiellales bacterium]